MDSVTNINTDTLCKVICFPFKYVDHWNSLLRKQPKTIMLKKYQQIGITIHQKIEKENHKN